MKQIKNILAVILVGLLFLSCKRPITSQVKVYENDIKDSANYYFPVYQLADTIEKMQNPYDTGFINEFPKHVSGYISHIKNKMYSQYLKAMKAEILRGSRKEVVRFTWLRSFQRPVSVSVQNIGDKVFLTRVILSDLGDIDPGSIQLSDTLIITPLVWKNIQGHLKSMDFWNMPSKSKALGMDGAIWILEVSSTDSYKFVERWSPEVGPFYDLCRDLLQYAQISEEDVY